VKDVKWVEIYRHLSAQYGDNVLPQQSVYEWIEMFKNGWTGVTDAEHSGCLSTSTRDEKQEQAGALIHDNRRTRVRDTATRSDISQGSSHTIMHDILGYHKVCARWVPKFLTEEHNHNHSDISAHLLEWYQTEDEHFFNYVIIADETWIHHYDPESKHQSMYWKDPASPSSKKIKTQPSARKVMLTVFWDSQGPILEHYQEKGTTVTNVRYCDMLRDELKPVIHKNGQEYCYREFFCCMTTPAFILLPIPRKHFIFEAFDHPPYSPGPCNF
jgi:histone-lysine N-methyltransferase SETMAR